MCVICIKKPGIDFPSLSIFERCFTVNPDGAGFMYAEGGQVHIVKGLMSFEAWKERYEAFLAEVGKEEAKNLPFVAHFRIGTHGSTDAPEHTHPFPIVDNYKEMEAKESVAEYAMAHNGIYSLSGFVGGYSKKYSYSSSYWSKTEEKLGQNNQKDQVPLDPSDSMEFSLKILRPLSRIPGWLNDPAVEKLIEHLNYGSRLVLLSGEGELKTFGHFIEHEGILYSNSSYEPEKPRAAAKSAKNDYGNLLPGSCFQKPYTISNFSKIRHSEEQYIARGCSGLQGAYDKLAKDHVVTWYEPAAIRYKPRYMRDEERFLNLIDPFLAYYLDEKTKEIYYYIEESDTVMLVGTLISFKYFSEEEYRKAQGYSTKAQEVATKGQDNMTKTQGVAL